MPLSPSEIREVVPNPKYIIAQLGKYVIGQENAKEQLALMLMTRSLVMLQRQGMIPLESEIQKNNVLLLGPTGSGKTELIKSLAKITGTVITTFDVTSITGAGYWGAKVEDILERHIDACKIAVEEVWGNGKSDSEYSEPGAVLQSMIETGIIYLDEIDKVVVGDKGSNVQSFSDLVQNELLKILEGTEVTIGNTKSSNSRVNKTINTKDIFFVCGGAFQGLKEVILKRIEKNHSIGFGSNIKSDASAKKNDNLFRFVTTKDLVDYGFKPELLGRLPLRASLDSLDLDAFTKIIKYSKGSVFKQYREMFKVFGVSLEITDEAIKSIAKLSSELDIGARSLKMVFANVCNPQLKDIFSCEEEKFIITPELVEEFGQGPKYEV